MYTFIQSNVWFGGTLHENLIPFLKKHNPDFIAMQEVCMPKSVSPYTPHPALDFLDKVKEETGLIHSVFVPEAAFKDKIHYNNTYPVDFGIAIVSRFPIKMHEYRSYIHDYKIHEWEGMNDWSVMHKGTLVAEIKTPEKPLFIGTTHGVWGFDDKDNADRDNMVDAILEAVGDKSPILFSGDLNIDQNTAAIGRIEQKMRSVFRDKLTTSFNMLHKADKGGGFATSVVDFVFASKDINILNAYSSEENVSDHVPLIVEFEV
jgi:endonuclease/exonuclease/phosphatase family metal-dependent hydrolase